MALTLSQIVKDGKNFKEKSIAEIDKSFWILDIFLSLKEWEWTISAELSYQLAIIKDEKKVILPSFNLSHCEVSMD